MKVIEGIIIESSPLTLEELSQAVSVEHDFVIEMVEYHLIEPVAGDSPESWEFDDVCLKRAKTAVSFYHDLEINMPGIALALDLLDKIEQLKNESE